MKNGKRNGDSLRETPAGACSRVTEEQGAHPAHGRAEGRACGEGVRAFSHLRKIDVMAQLAGSLARYFNDIFALIMGYGGYLGAQLDPQDPLGPYVHRIVASSERAAALTRSLLAVTGKRPAGLKPVDMKGVMRRAVAVAAGRAAARSKGIARPAEAAPDVAVRE